MGEPGRDGVTGPPEPPGEPATPTLIKLPVDVVLVSPAWESNRIMDLRRTLKRTRDFWAAIDIDIQLNISWLQADESTLDYDSPDFSKMHYQRGGARLACYVGSTLEVLPNTPNHAGSAATFAGVHGTALLAGAHGGTTDSENLMPETLNHELGHILGLAHDNSTFMRESIRRDENPVGSAQRETLQAAAYDWGGF